MLDDIITNGIALPVLTDGVDGALVNFNLRFTLKELNGEPLRCVPSDVTVHKPGLDNDIRYGQL